MNRLYFLLVIIITSCFCTGEGTKKKGAFIVNDSHFKLSEVINTLINDSVKGFVLIHYKTNEYSSLEKARNDTSIAKSVVSFDTDNIRLHMPISIIDDEKYNWGSPLIFRKVMEDHGDVIKVQTTDVDLVESLGHGGLGADYMYNVVTYVRKKDLIPVLSKVFTKTFHDNTLIKLYPGVAIGIPWNSDQTKRAVSVQQMHFEFRVPDNLLALSYNPNLLPLKKLDGKMMLDENAILFLGGKTFSPASEFRSIRMRTPINHINEKGTKLVHLIENGIELILNTKSDLVRSYVPNIDLPTLTPRFKTPPRWYYRIREGTTIYWEDGRVAGKVRQAFGSQSITAPKDSKWCEIRSEFLKNEPLCFRVQDIEVMDNEK